MPSARVFQLHQDNQGFLWLATNNGIGRFDGYSFQNFSNSISDSTSLSGDYIYRITSDSSFLWVGHYEGGLDLFDMTSGKVVRHWDENDSTNAIPDNKITKLWVEKSKNRIWVGTSKEHFAWVDLTTGDVKIPTLNNHPDNIYPSPKRNSIYDIVPHQSNPNIYWLATNEGLALYNESDRSLRYFYPITPTSGYNNYNRLRDIEIIDNKIWIATRGDGGLLAFDVTSEKWEKYQISENAQNLSSQLIRKSENELWISTLNENNAIIAFNLKDKSFEKIQANTSLPHKLQSNVVFDLLKDIDGNIWIPTEKGLSFLTMAHQRFPTNRFQLEEIKKSTPLSFETFEGNLYAGLSYSYGILQINPKNGTQKLIKTDRPFERFAFIRSAVSPKKELWVTGQNSLFKLSANKNLLLTQNPPIAKKKKIRYQSLCFVDDQTLLIGTRFNGVLVWNQKTNSTRFINKTTSNLVHDRFINEIKKDDNGHIWISTERGISILDATTLKVLKNYGLEDGFKMTYRITLDTKGTMWASSENMGVYGFNTTNLKQEKRITKANGLPSNAIQHIAADHDGNLWISTQQGLCKYNLSDESILIFTTENGLIENHLEGSLNRGPDGSMVLGFKGAFTVFDSEAFNSNFIKKPPVISEVKIVDQLLYRQPSTSVVLPYDKNSLSFGFTALNYAIPENLIYHYRLIGSDENWTRSSNTLRANYTNLGSGDYTFQVHYSIKGIEGMSESTSFDFTIKPPFWKTNWFYALCILSVGLVIRAFYNAKISQVKNEEKLKTEMNKELSALEMKALRSQMNPHFIFNSLNSIKYYVLQNETNKASKYLNDFSKLIRRIFNNTQTEFSILEEEIETLKLFLEIEKLRFGDKMNFVFDIDPDLELPFIKVPNMLIQPFIENSVWHGIMHKPEGGTIIVRFKMLENDYLSIEVEDDGIGRDAAQRRRSVTIDHKSKGIKLTQKRINLINENLDMDISLNIEDLYNDLEPLGTKVILKMKIIEA